jgi:hypothetical protein
MKTTASQLILSKTELVFLTKQKGEQHLKKKATYASLQFNVKGKNSYTLV